MKSNSKSLFWFVFIVSGFISELIMVLFVPCLVILALRIYSVISTNFSLLLLLIAFSLSLVFLLKVKRTVLIKNNSLIVKNLLGATLLEKKFTDIEQVYFHVRFDGIYNVIEVFVDYKHEEKSSVRYSFTMLPDEARVDSHVSTLKEKNVKVEKSGVLPWE